MSDQTTGTIWRAHVLPLSKISHRGRELNFDSAYLGALVDAFDQGAYDRVPFQLADEPTNDPSRCRGFVRRFEVVQDGLDALVAVTAEGHEALSNDPQMGAAPSIREGYQRADGRVVPAAIRHILGTHESVLTGLRPWQLEAS